MPRPELKLVAFMPLKITQLLQLLLIALLLFASQTASSQSAIAVAGRKRYTKR
jgi:hypothetical protein